MNIFQWILFIYLLSVCDSWTAARNVYENHYNERENVDQVNIPYTKRKAYREEYREGDDTGSEFSDSGNVDSQRLRQYEPSELYNQPDSSRVVKLNGDSSMYNVKKRDYLDDMKSGRDTQYQVVLDPKSRKPVAVIDNQAGQDSQNFQAWRNQRDFDQNQGYDSDYLQSNQEQVYVYPSSRHDRTSNRANNYDFQSRDNYNGQYRNEGSMKMKRHVSLEKRNTQKTEEVKQRNSDQNKDCKGTKRSVPSWSKEQIQALKDSLSAFQENDAAYENLRNVLNNMGLFENMLGKRETKEEKDSEEDENINNSGIVLKQNVKKRNEEEEGMEKRQAKVGESKGESKRKSEEKKSVLTDKEHREGERKRRENDNLIKSLEKSGEVTLSGNKSPLAKNEISGDAAAERKRDATDDEDYDQKIESEIQAKIDAIKEKVKREILMEKQKRQNSRSKRAVTLLDSETKNINPEFISYDSLKPHIRTRRHLNETLRRMNSTKNATIPSIFLNTTLEETYEELYENSSKDSFEPHKRVRREAKNELTNSKVKKRETGDSALSSRKKRANNLAENKMVFRPYLSQQDEDEESENNEFDNLYEQQYVEKREAFDPDYQYFEKEDSQEFQAQEKSPGYSENLHPVKRQSRSHLSEEEHYEPYIRPRNRYRYKVFRDKRDNEKVQLHGGMVSRKLIRNKELVDDRGKRGNMDDEESVESDNEFFGALPQNYQEGELNRYKRIKRNGPVKKPES